MVVKCSFAGTFRSSISILPIMEDGRIVGYPPNKLHDAAGRPLTLGGTNERKHHPACWPNVRRPSFARGAPSAPIPISCAFVGNVGSPAKSSASRASRAVGAGFFSSMCRKVGLRTLGPSNTTLVSVHRNLSRARDQSFHRERFR